ncbi:amylovoran biosynthesis protein AmsF [Erwinia amylovora]|uniref:amylovoran biosynthesis protein AmsF n=1 Tax=Erwinia amylovora TaxID=552 RepID=UPI000C08116D|nr:amylovoran biosynthesis protein AmsF [Erwinia amylovora]MBZ2398164.1 amylovoran biosynthesis protein AmsF [Erwinia amylovora]MBZ2401594.1 amylovoran biosynthesis protein AmsF [Erwinia amylovora]
MIELNSFAELRMTVPSKSGEVVFLKSYYDNEPSPRGGGHFIGLPATTDLKDDNGTIALGEGFYWKRAVTDPQELNVLHFGAKGDGKTDDTGAFTSMLSWVQNYNQNIKSLPVRFPCGRFLIKPLDFSGAEIPFFGLEGVGIPLGSLPSTTIVSDQSSNTVFKINARRMTIKGLTWDGQASADTNNNVGTITAEMCSNVQPFLENICQGGQLVNISHFRGQYSGGTIFKLQDTFDSKFEQFYTLKTFSRVLDVGWSNRPEGAWDHSTAIELCNANFQSGYGDATLYMPRVTQGIIRNVWIEHTRNPGNLSDGGWTIDTLNIEDCHKPFILSNSRILMRQINLQSGSTLDLAKTSGRWLSDYEYGHRRDENYGTSLTGSLKVGYFSGYKLENNTDKDNWYRLGRLYFAKSNQLWEIELISKADSTAPSDSATSPVNLPGAGKTWINLQKLDSVSADCFHRGQPAILEMRYSREGTSRTSVWVKLKAKSGATMFNLTTTGPTRFESGVCSLFDADMSLVSDESQIGSLKPVARFGIHNGVAGIGANEKGLVTLATATGIPADKTTPTGFVLLNINGAERKVAYYD